MALKGHTLGPLGPVKALIGAHEAPIGPGLHTIKPKVSPLGPQKGPQGLHLCKNYICAASRNTRDRIMLIRAKHRTIV